MTRTYSIARAGFVVMVLNGVAIVAAFVREATIAYYYGASAVFCQIISTICFKPVG